MNIIDFKNASCKHCYKCVRTCSVKAIRVKNAQAQIMTDYCVLCGHCLEVCPQNAKTFASDLEMVKAFLREGKTVALSIAPSYLGIFDYERPGQIICALKKLGFTYVRETAEGAALVTDAYQKLMDEGQMENIITTCCPSVNDLVEKYYPELIGDMAPVVSPMIAHGMLMKKLYGDSVKTVFAGPCVAKKEEAREDERTEGFIDAVITFAELEDWFAEAGIDVFSCEEMPVDNPDPKINRLYPGRKGVLTSVETRAGKALNGHLDGGSAPQTADSRSDGAAYRMFDIDGMENCRELFEEMKAGRLKGCFIEANMCEGGCIKGPAVNKLNISRFESTIEIEKQVQHRPAEISDAAAGLNLHKTFYSRQLRDDLPTEEQIRKILKATGKNNKDEELNCGACGYPSCREKAIAVFQGKAENDMCLPYAYETANSMSNVVMETTPNMILIVDEQLKIMEMNRKAEEVFGVDRETAIKTMYVFEMLDASDFESVLNRHTPIYRKKLYLEAYKMTVLETIVYVANLDAALAIFQDVTADERELQKQMETKVEVVGIAQEVIEKQMMVAQEIAGLLGETTAETKAILTKLRGLVLPEADKDKNRSKSKR